nr:BsuPI-related putative proteinase inhibitor [Sporosalibacterium faouarense]
MSSIDNNDRITNIEKTAIGDENDTIVTKPKFDEQSIVKGKLETRGSYEIKDGKVIFDFELMNHYTDAIQLEFGSGQQYEIIITDEAGKEVYKYSEGKFFTMALVYKSISPGESLKWQDSWDMTNKKGEKLTTGKYKAKITVAARTGENDRKTGRNSLTTIIDFRLQEFSKEEVKQIAKNFLPEGTEFTTPKESQQGESFTQIDLNKDGNDEIVAFYKGQSSVGAIVIEQDALGWKLKNKIEGYGNSLNYVGFHDIDGNDKLDILIGGQDENNNNKLLIYKLNNRTYEEINSLYYERFSIGNLDEDSKLDIATLISLDNEMPSVKLQVYSLFDNAYKLEFEKEFKYSSFPYNIAIGGVSREQKGIFADMVVGAHSAITEVFIKENGEYKSALKEKGDDELQLTFKPYPLESQDVNNDGVIEIGIQSAPPETDDLPMAAIPWINCWYKLDDEGRLVSEPVMKDYSNYSEGYKFSIPKSWYGKFTIKREIVEESGINSVQFMYLAKNNQKARFFTLHHIAKSDWEHDKQRFQEKGKSYFILGENNTNMFVIELPQGNKVLRDDNLNEYKSIFLDREGIIDSFVAYGDNGNAITWIGDSLK